MNLKKVLRHALYVAIVVLGLCAPVAQRTLSAQNDLPKPQCVWVEDPETGLMICWVL
jgi:hypothetical protein